MTNIANTVNAGVANQFSYARKTLNSTQITGMFGTSILFDSIPTPASNQSIIIRNFETDLSFNSAQYTAGGVINLYYDNARTQSASVGVAASAITGSVSAEASALGTPNLISAANSKGNPIYISNATQAFASGNSNVTFHAWYSLVTFDSSGIANKLNNNTNSATWNFAQLYIPSASVQTLDSSPLTIVSSPGSGFMLIPDRMICLLIFNSVAYSNATVQLIYGTSSTVLMSSTTNFISGTSSQHCQVSPAFSSFTPSNGDNNSLQIKASASPGASGNSALKIYLTYSIVQL